MGRVFGWVIAIVVVAIVAIVGIRPKGRHCQNLTNNTIHDKIFDEVTTWTRMEGRTD